MDKLTKLRNQHEDLSADLVALFVRHDSLQTERWANPKGIADVVAAELLINVSALVDDHYFEPIMKVLEPGDMFAHKSEYDNLVVLSIIGSTAKILDLLDFEEKMITIQRDREYVVCGHIEEED